MRLEQLELLQEEMTRIARGRASPEGKRSVELLKDSELQDDIIEQANGKFTTPRTAAPLFDKAVRAGTGRPRGSASGSTKPDGR